MRAQLLDAGAAGQALALEQVEGDLERLLSALQFGAGRLAVGHALLAPGMQIDGARLCLGQTRSQLLAALPEPLCLVQRA
ncbi:hypothetical protein D3C81_2072280 [compost metagenome]